MPIDTNSDTNFNIGVRDNPLSHPIPGNQATQPYSDGTTYPDRQQAAKAGVPKVDHLAEIEQLARRNGTTSPSGAETLCQQILIHVQALRDPAAYDKAEAEKRAADDKENARQAKITAERKGNVPDKLPLHHRGAQGTAQPDQRLP